jgi:hypothetical protein
MTCVRHASNEKIAGSMRPFGPESMPRLEALQDHLNLIAFRSLRPNLFTYYVYNLELRSCSSKRHILLVDSSVQANSIYALADDAVHTLRLVLFRALLLRRELTWLAGAPQEFARTLELLHGTVLRLNC